MTIYISLVLLNCETTPQ